VDWFLLVQNEVQFLVKVYVPYMEGNLSVQLSKC
jgi:hypothetical protein